METEKRYKLWQWHDDIAIYEDGGSQNKHFMGVYGESFCRAYCRQYAGRNGIHIYAEEVTES